MLPYYLLCWHWQGFSTVVILWVGVVAHTCNPGTKGAEVGGS